MNESVRVFFPNTSTPAYRLMDGLLASVTLVVRRPRYPLPEGLSRTPDIRNKGRILIFLFSSGLERRRGDDPSGLRSSLPTAARSPSGLGSGHYIIAPWCKLVLDVYFLALLVEAIVV